MPPEKVAQTASWGKRPRDADEAIVRFSDLSPEQKVARRRQERQEKKERERTMSYFKSVQRVLEEHAAGSGDANVLASLVDGFFVELVKLIKADPSLHLLRNGTVCRVIELGLANALLLQSKSLLYVFLGHVAELATSPVASYVLESICLSISQGLSALAATSTEQLEMELVVGGAGSHVGSGVPSSATLLNSMVEELVEAMDDLIAHEVGARALRSIILVLGGHTIRDAPTPPHRIVLDDVLARLAEGVIAAVEGGRYHAKNPAEAWMAAVQAPTTGFIIQSLLRVCVDGSPADRIVRVRLDGLSYRGEAFLRFLLRDALGCHTLQAYIKVAAPVKVVRDYTAYAMRRDGAKDGKSAWLKNVGVDDDNDNDASSSSFTVSDECCWSRAARLVHHELDDLLSPQSSLVLQASFVVHDLALYAPTVLHLEWLWATMIQPRLATFLQISSLAAVLAAMTRKYAFAGSVADENENGNATTSGAAMIPADLNQLLRRDEAQQVPYFDVPMAMQKELCEALVEAVKTSGCAKGVAQFLLADAQLGDRGVEMMRYLLHLHPLASTRIQNSFDKLRVDDVVRLSCQHGGSLAIQQLLRAESYRTTNSSNNSAPSTSSSSNNNNNKKEGGGMVARFLRRIQEHLGVLARDRFGAFVVEVLYIVCCIDEKEALIKALVPLYESLKSAGEMEQMSNNNNNNTTTEEVGEMDGLSTDMQKRLVLRKVCQKCCVEQYLHRPDDWRKLAERQQQVQRLVWRMWMGY